MSNKTKTVIFYTSALLLFLVVIGYAKLSRFLIITNHAISNCHVDEVKTVGREHFVRVKYHFSVDGETYYSDASFSQLVMNLDNSKLLEDKSLPVAYNDKYYKMLSYVLIFPKDYEAFNMPFPDSLKWILPLMESR